MNLFTGKSQLLALLFLVLSCITLCLSSPTQSLADPVPLGKRTFLTVTTFGSNGGLVRRQAPGDNLKKYERMLEDIQANEEVGVNEQKFRAFKDKPTVLGSTGFESCFGIVILSKKGVIIGHYNPSDDMIERAEEHIPNLYHENRDTLTDATAYLFVSVRLHHGEKYYHPGLESRLEGMIKNDLGLEPHIVKYTEMGDLSSTSGEDIREDYDDWVHKAMNGVIMVKDPGQKDPKGPEIDFIHLDAQKNP